VLYVGLSGGIGSGKSTVSARLADLGAVVVDADRIARDVVAPGTPGLAAVVERFGHELLLPDGGLDRPALGAIVFADEGARRDLEAIIHPLVRDETARRRADAPCGAIVVHDVPLLVEGDLAPDYHLTVIVDAAQDVRSTRLRRDRRMSQEEAAARIAAQASDEQRYAVADVVLDNNGTRAELIDRVEALWHERLAPYNEHLLAGTPAPRGEGSVDPAVTARGVARLRRQVDLAGLDEQIESMQVVADGVIEIRTAGSVVADELRAALLAAGFVCAPEPGDCAACDPAAPVAVRLPARRG